jgi:Homing endonuclease associated repeat
VSNKQHILRRITEVAKKLGRAPSLLEFVALSEISRYSVSLCFPKWNDAVREAGLHPRRLRVRPEDDDLLKDWGKAVRRKRTLPSRRAYLLAGRHEPRTLEKRFGGWESVPQAFRKFAKGKREWADVLALLPAAAPTKAAERPRSTPASPVTRRQARPALPKDRATYGNPMNFHEMRHEPVNEQGVVLLFGILAKKLGYTIEAVQTGFPDCEAKRQIGPDRWQRVRIEFEFESRNFRDHGHPSTGCDVIVCWRHNWDECPKGIEIVELCSIIKSLGSLHD